MLGMLSLSLYAHYSRDQRRVTLQDGLTISEKDVVNADDKALAVFAPLFRYFAALFDSSCDVAERAMLAALLLMRVGKFNC